MVKLPARILVVAALAGLLYGVFSVSRMNSSPAQDVAPPGCIEGGEPGSSEPGAAGGSPGSVGENPGPSGGSSGSGGNSGSIPGNSGSAGGGTSGSGGSGDPNGTVSSVVNPNEGAFEWTLERMLLATPMPMTGEERSFLFKHPPLEQLQSWKQADFDQYIADPLGLRHAAEEGVRWRGLSAMLKRQATSGSKFLADDKSEAPIFHSSIDLRGAEFDSFDFEKFQLGLKKDPIGGFIKMRQWRQEIKVRAALVESMRKKAAQQGKTEEFEKAIDDSGSN